jgi:hypothetical protein
MKKCYFFFLMALWVIPVMTFAKNAHPDKLIKVKVVVVYEDPKLPMFGNKRIHECMNTPSVKERLWNDPIALSADYKKTLEEVSGNVVDYEIVKEIQADHFFTFLKNDPLKRHLTLDEISRLLSEPEWKTLKSVGTSYDYNGMIKFYGLDKLCDNEGIHEVWVWTFPYCGMYESHMMGEKAFFINSDPDTITTCKGLLNIMGLNYERDLACAMESYGHRFESTMMKVYGWWKYDKKTSKEELTTWERYAGYSKIYNKFDVGKSNIGNIHYPPNGQIDYNWNNKDRVLSYADEWLNYPNVKESKARWIDCAEWDCSHIGYMKWWFMHIPHYKGINPKDGKLNNWWLYVVDYTYALQQEQLLNKRK